MKRQWNGENVQSNAGNYDSSASIDTSICDIATIMIGC